MIRWSVKSHITQRDSAAQRHTEELDRAIKVLIMDGVFIMPDASHWARHFIDYESAAIDSRLGLDSSTGRSRPRTGRRGHSDRNANGRKGETRRAGDIVTAIGGIVVHVALPGVGLAPGVLMWTIVLNFEVVGRAHVHRCIQVSGIH